MDTLTEDILNFHCPRWHELPDIDLYMDQLLSILEKNLSVFESVWGEKIITSMMINNYVKQKIVKPPVKKRYNKEHLAYFFVVCIMKRIFSISEICDLITYLVSISSIDCAYNLFCDELENSIRAVFSQNALLNKQTLENQHVILISSTLAFANKMYFQVKIKNL